MSVPIVGGGGADRRPASCTHYRVTDRGGTLKQAIQRDGPFPERRALRIARAIAEGVAAAHAQGVGHGDLSSENVLIDAAGHPTIADLGIDRSTADERADVYGLGVILYELLTGILPSRAEMPPRRIRTAIDPETDALVLQAMAKRPAKRFASAAELRDAIDVLLGEARAAPVSPPVPSPTPGPGTAGRPAAGIVAALVALLALAAIVVGLRIASGIPTPTPTPTIAGLAVTAEPIPSSISAASASPSPTAAPTIAAPTIAAPTTAAPASTVPVAAIPVAASDPAATILSFYRLVTDRQYVDSASLWSARMQANYPPASNINGRFADTRSIIADRAEVTSRGPNEATVSVYVTEVTTSGTRHWAGTWYLVRSGSVWLMDAPQLGPA